MADPLTPDWWLDRLYRKLHDRRPQIQRWDDLYTGNHPAPQGYEKAQPLMQRLLETVGLNVLQTVTDAAHERQQVMGFKVNGKINDDVWAIWQANDFDNASSQIFQEKMALSEAYALVDPNDGDPIVTAEHPEQCIVERDPGARFRRAAGLKVWQDDQSGTPLVKAMVYLPDAVYLFAAPTRAGMQHYAQRPQWELQEEGSGPNPLGEVPLVPFSNRGRLMRAPVPEFTPAIIPQRRINKTLLDRMAMQDQGAFKAMWATGLSIPVDPVSGDPVEPFSKAIDRMFINEDPNGKFGQLEAEDIKQILEAVNEDVKHATVVVPTPPDQLLGEMVNVSAEGLKSAQASLITRVRRHMRADEEPLETTARLSLKASGKDVPNASSMTTIWRNPEFRTEGEMVDAGLKALSAGMPHEAVWERYLGADPQEIGDWRQKLDDRMAQDPIVTASRALAGGSGATGSGQ